MVRYLFYTIGDLTYLSPLVCWCVSFLNVYSWLYLSAVILRPKQHMRAACAVFGLLTPSALYY